MGGGLRRRPPTPRVLEPLGLWLRQKNTGTLLSAFPGGSLLPDSLWSPLSSGRRTVNPQDPAALLPWVRSKQDLPGLGDEGLPASLVSWS